MDMSIAKYKGGIYWHVREIWGEPCPVMVKVTSARLGEFKLVQLIGKRPVDWYIISDPNELHKTKEEAIQHMRDASLYETFRKMERSV